MTGRVVTAHGLVVTLPGHHSGVIFTDSHDDSQQFALLLVRAGCKCRLFDTPPSADVWPQPAKGASR